MDPKKFKAATQRAIRFLHTDLIDIVAVEGQKHFKHSFHRGVEGFTDERLEKWPDIKEATKKRKRRKRGGLPPILTDVGHLADSINYNADYGQQKVIFSSSEPYGKAEVHNEGGGPKKMPKRQFMGPSQVLDQKVIEIVEKHLDRIFN